MDSYYKRNNNSIYCLNCNKQGHVYKKCKAPLNSYGIIIFKKFFGSNVKYLMIQRKYSYSFLELMLSKYIENGIINYYKLSNIIKHLPKTERYLIQNNDFLYLWNKMWMYNMSELNSRFHEYMKKFNYLKDYCLDLLFDNIHPILDQPEWEFPKGKRIIGESDMDCAIRECEEETNYSNDDYYIYPNLKHFQDKFKGTDNNDYCNNYYLAELSNYDKLVYFDPTNFHQSTEIRKIGWFTFNEIKDKIKDVSPSKFNMINHINFLINCWQNNNKYKHFSTVNV